MRASNGLLRNDDYNWVEDDAKAIHAAALDLISSQDAKLISDEAVAHLFSAAVRLYFAKADLEDRTFSPLLPEDTKALSPSELLSAVSELLRALHLGPMELALWYRARPEDQR
jgi:hypothetical protein